MKAENSTRIQFDSLSSNEAYARGVTAAFLARYDPTGAYRAGVHDHSSLPRPGGAHHHYR